MSGLQRSTLGLSDGSEHEILGNERRGGPALLYLHGLGGLAADEALVSALATRFSVRAPSLDTFGSINDVPIIQRQVAELLKALSLDRPLLAGHGAGAAVAAELAATMPGAFSHLFLIAPVGLHADQRPISGEGIENRMAHIDCRTTLVWGKQDTVVSMASILDLVRAIPSAGIATVPQGTNDMVSTLPDKVARAMANGLRISIAA